MQLRGGIAGRVAAAALAALAAPALAETPARPGVRVSGLDGRSETLGMAELAARAHRTATLVHDGRTTVYAGAALSDLLRDVGAPLGVRMHGEAVSDLVVVSAADGYRVTLSLAEVDPATHGGALAILADQADGRPLDPREGPLRLIVDGDVKAARAARQVVEVALRRLP